MCTRCAFLGGLAAATALPSLASARTGDPQALELALPAMRRIADTVWLAPLTPNVWIHTTTHVIEDAGFYPANGMIVAGERESLLVDTGWTPAQTRVILDAWHRSRRPPIRTALVTHFHRDRLGGIGELTARRIPAFGHPRTVGLARAHGFLPPRPLASLPDRPQRLGATVVAFHGEGHTSDNMVAWVPAERVLFGGCLVKSTTASDLGYVADGNVPAYAGTIASLRRAYASRHVIPGHGTIAGDSLAHTHRMAEAAASAKP